MKKTRAELVGTVITLALNFIFDEDGNPIRGGNQKLKKILGSLYYQKKSDKTWFFATTALKNLSDADLKKLIEQLKNNAK